MNSLVQNLAGIPMPRIGQPCADGTFVGIAAGRTRADQDSALILLDPASTKMGWREANEYAVAKGATLATRADGRIIWANHDRFLTAKQGYFWLQDEYEGGSDYAWVQGFDGGGQRYGHRDFEYHVRPVRRFPLQYFDPSAAK
jgi:hypothetical protein